MSGLSNRHPVPSEAFRFRHVVLDRVCGLVRCVIVMCDQRMGVVNLDRTWKNTLGNVQVHEHSLTRGHDRN